MESLERSLSPVIRVSQPVIAKPRLDAGRLRAGLARLEMLNRELGAVDRRRFHPAAAPRVKRGRGRVAAGLMLLGNRIDAPLLPVPVLKSAFHEEIDRATREWNRYIERKNETPAMRRARVCAERAKRREVIIAKGLRSGGGPRRRGPDDDIKC